MFLMRRATTEDVSTLHKLAKMVHFINLPADKDIIADKAAWSAACFEKAAGSVEPGSVSRGTQSLDRGAGPVYSSGKGGGEDGLAAAVSRSDLFMFVLEDTEAGGILGTSQIIAHMGGPGRPNVSLRLSKKEMFSQTLQMGASHVVAKLFLDESGPTEIGGLILAPSHRGHKAKLGRFLSLIRFHFAALHRPFFADRIIAELMGPVTPDGHNTMWEYLGRRFINLTYSEADSFCQYSKEFITALMPREEIYLTLLAPEARAVIGTVGPETIPARRMLEKLGFAYKDLVDPFDGGPTLEALTDEISLIRDTKRLPLSAAAPMNPAQSAIVSTLTADGDFRAVQTRCEAGPDGLRLSPEDREALCAEPGQTVGYTPLAESAGTSSTPRSGATKHGAAARS
jgi:arginine N-succinyltransferase